jgi:hypothetical protein
LNTACRPVASRSLQIAKDYPVGLASLESVADALHACWGELGNGREMQLDNPEVSAIRAAICTLHSQIDPESDDIVDVLSFCLRLLNTVEPHFAAQETLLSRYFGDRQRARLTT